MNKVDELKFLGKTVDEVQYMVPKHLTQEVVKCGDTVTLEARYDNIMFILNKQGKIKEVHLSHEQGIQ